jgi:hypothetical protein
MNLNSRLQIKSNGVVKMLLKNVLVVDFHPKQNNNIVYGLTTQKMFKNE